MSDQNSSGDKIAKYVGWLINLPALLLTAVIILAGIGVSVYLAVDFFHSARAAFGSEGGQAQVCIRKEKKRLDFQLELVGNEQIHGLPEDPPGVQIVELIHDIPLIVTGTSWLDFDCGTILADSSNWKAIEDNHENAMKEAIDALTPFEKQRREDFFRYHEDQRRLFDAEGQSPEQSN